MRVPPIPSVVFASAPLPEEKVFMYAPHRSVSPVLPEDRQPPIATFKMSLRAWQACYKAQLAARTIVAEKAPRQSETG